MASNLIADELVAGDTWAWTASFDGYDSSDYALAIHFRNLTTADKLDATEVNGRITKDPGGSAWLVSIAAADTAPLPAGDYSWSADVTLDGARTTLDRGVISVLADVAAAAGAIDIRTFEEQTLAAIRKILQGSAGREEEQYQVDGRMLKLRTLDELRKMEHEFSWRVRQQKIERGELPPESNQVRFGFRGVD